MMAPIALSVAELAPRRRCGEGLAGIAGAPEEDADARNFTMALLLSVAYASSIGGLGTIIGSPPNGILVRFLEQAHGIRIPFTTWMALGVPVLLVFLPVTWWVTTRLLFPTRIREIEGGRRFAEEEYRKLGKLNAGERATLIVFCAAVFLWMFRPLLAEIRAAGLSPFRHLSDTSVAVGAALALFLFPVDRAKGLFAADWSTAVRLPWGVLLLFGGGLALADAVVSNGVAASLTFWDRKSPRNKVVKVEAQNVGKWAGATDTVVADLSSVPGDITETTITLPAGYVCPKNKWKGGTVKVTGSGKTYNIVSNTAGTISTGAVLTLASDSKALTDYGSATHKEVVLVKTYTDAWGRDRHLNGLIATIDRKEVYMNTRAFWLSTLIAGVAIAVFGNLPVFNLINCALCVWVWLGGALSVILYRRFQGGRPVVSAGQGAGLGALSGLIGAVLGAGVFLITSPHSLSLCLTPSQAPWSWKMRFISKMDFWEISARPLYSWSSMRSSTLSLVRSAPDRRGIHQTI